MLNLDNLNIVLFIIPIYQMLFYSVQLIALREKKDPSKRILGFLMLLMVIYLTINASSYLGYDSFYKYLFIMQLPVLLAIFPTYYLYLKTISSLSSGVSLRPLLMYYLPSIIILILNIAALINMNTNQVNTYLSSRNFYVFSNDTAINFASLIFLLGNAGLIAAQVILTIFYHKKSMHKLSDIREHNSTYLPNFEVQWSNIIFLSIISFVILCSIMNFAAPAFNNSISTIINIGILISGGLAGYFGLKQDKLNQEVNSISTINFKVKDVIEDNNINTIKSVASNSNGLSEEEAHEIMEILEFHLVNKKPYLNKELRIVDLAKSIGTSKQKITYVLNNLMETNFYGIMNKYRVLEAKELLLKTENQNYNINVISELAGFQSKSSFNACFKKVTGQTPSEYRKSYT